MNKIEKIKKEIARKVSYINGFTSEIKILQDKLNQLELINWQPDNGNFIVETSGTIFDKTHCNYDTDIMNLEIDFGSVRINTTRAKNASRNMRKFNRLSCFMGDTPVNLEFGINSVSLVFYDYDYNSTKISTLKKILEIKGEL